MAVTSPLAPPRHPRGQRAGATSTLQRLRGNVPTPGGQGSRTQVQSARAAGFSSHPLLRSGDLTFRAEKQEISPRNPAPFLTFLD